MHNCFIFLRFLSMLSFICFFKTFMFIYLNLKRRGHRAGMPEWSKGPDSSKNLLLDKNSRFLVDNVCVGSNPTFSIFFFAPLPDYVFPKIERNRKILE